MNRQERALVDLLTKLWPNGAVHRLDGDGDRQWRSAAQRLIEAEVVKRLEEADVEVDGETVDIAVYRLEEDMIRSIGGTSTPHLN
jgi:hypothetical protein